MSPGSSGRATPGDRGRVLHEDVRGFGEFHIVEPPAMVVRELRRRHLPATRGHRQRLFQGVVPGVPGHGHGERHLGLGDGFEGQAGGYSASMYLRDMR